jgi:hypothetical protein
VLEAIGARLKIIAEFPDGEIVSRQGASLTSKQSDLCPDDKHSRQWPSSYQPAFYFIRVPDAWTANSPLKVRLTFTLIVVHFTRQFKSRPHWKI